VVFPAIQYRKSVGEPRDGVPRILAILVQDNAQLGGIVTDRDLAIRVVGQGLDAGETSLDEVMTHDPATLPASASERDAGGAHALARYSSHPAAE
jgi:CBS domain-containing protein